MAPKSSSAAKEKLIDEEDEVLQAVVLADSFNKRFKPLTARMPRCLLPICNATMLDWTFESLALAGVQEIFVICRSHADLVKAAIEESKWSKSGSAVKIVPIVTAKETFSPGDAMRDIYTHGIITSDFVLVSGDLVSNVRIDEVVRAHKERRKTNKDAIMTMVLKPSGRSHRTRSKGDSSVFVMDAHTSECLHYEPIAGYPPTGYTRIPREVLAEHPEIEIRNDLIDCSIDVCSNEVPSLFQDNFDYLDIRQDFVHGVLTSDLLMKNIYCYVLKEGYAARVKDTKSYDSISKDILSRWTFPLVPDDNHPGGHVYEHLRGNKYYAKDGDGKSKPIILARTCKIGNNTLIGASTKVYDNARIFSSVIGRNCTIGANAVVRNAYIFDGTIVSQNCVVEECIVASGVVLKEGTHVARGCLVGEGVVLGPQAKLAPFDRVSKKREKGKQLADDDDESDSDSELEDIDAVQKSLGSALGTESNAMIWPRRTAPPERDSDSDTDSDHMESFSNQRLMRLGDNCSDLSLSYGGSTTSEDESESSSSPDASVTVPSDVEAPEFRTEVALSLARAFDEGHAVDNAAVELKTLRMASNVPLDRVREAVVGAIVDRIPLVGEDTAAQRREIGTMIGRWGQLINKIGGVDCVATVTALQVHCASSPERMPLFGQILASLYQNDVVEEDDIRRWHTLPASKGINADTPELKENLKKCWDIGGVMIHQFNEQESDDDDEEGEDDVGDEDEDDDEEDEEDEDEESGSE